MNKNILRITFAAVLLAVPAAASTLQYSVVVNTSSIGFTGLGEIDMYLTPGVPAPFAVELTTASFNNTADLGPAEGAIFGNPAGSLATSLIMDNSGGGSAYFHEYNLGNTFRFVITFTGAGVPGTGSPSDTLFELFLTGQGGDPVYPDGSSVLSIRFTPDSGAVINAAPGIVSIAETPEPGTLLLLGASGAMLIAIRRFRRA